MIIIPKADLDIAQRRALSFRVLVKEAQGKPWDVIKDEIPDLAEAVTAAERIEMYESAVFVIGRDRCGFKYWSSRTSDLFNSVVLNEGYSL